MTDKVYYFDSNYKINIVSELILRPDLIYTNCILQRKTSKIDHQFNIKFKQVGPYKVAFPLINCRKKDSSIVIMKETDKIRLVEIIVNMINCNEQINPKITLPKFVTNKSPYDDISIVCKK